jgi:putative ABC transport system substrate-binding protein
MGRKITAFALCSVLVALCVSVEAQQSKNIPRIGFLSLRAGIEPREEAFRQGLRKLGYIEERNIGIEWRFANGQNNRVRELLGEMVQLKLRLIVAGGGVVAQEAKLVTELVPVVFTVASDPVGAGIVKSLSRPGGNITGLTLDAPGLAGKRVEMLKESFPKLSRIALLYHRQSPSWKIFMAESEQAARQLKVQLQPVGVAAIDELDNAFSTMIKDRAEAVVKFPSGILTSHRKRIVELVAKSRLPAMYEDSVIVDDGGLMSYGPDITDLYRRSSIFVDKILKGAKPTDLPVEQPMKFEFVVNLKSAKQIGLTIPPNVLVRADRVIR